jgi:hypothetical protein
VAKKELSGVRETLSQPEDVVIVMGAMSQHDGMSFSRISEFILCVALHVDSENLSGRCTRGLCVLLDLNWQMSFLL